MKICIFAASKIIIMKKATIFCLTAILMACNFFSFAQKQTFPYQGNDRQYYLYVPASYNSSTDRLPVLVFLHGFDGGIDTYNSNIDFQQAADQFHWMIVLPGAMPMLNLPISIPGLSLGDTWNSGIVMTIMGMSFTPNSDVDDSGFLMALVDNLGTSYTLDPDSLFFTGFSMGAFMTHRMGIEHSDRIKGIATASGLIPHCFADATPAHHLHVLHIHGTNDDFIHPDGTAEPIPMAGEMDLGLSVDETVSFWRNANQCGPDAETYAYPNTVNDGMTFTLNTYKNSTDLTRVGFINVEGGEHKWYEDDQHDVKYLTVVHDFFTNHIPSTGIDEGSLRRDLTLYPNPAHNTLTVETPNETQLSIYSTDGRVIATMPLTAGANVLNLTPYPAGLYLLRTTDGHSSTLVIK